MGVLHTRGTDTAASGEPQDRKAARSHRVWGWPPGSRCNFRAPLTPTVFQAQQPSLPNLPLAPMNCFTPAVLHSSSGPSASVFKVATWAGVGV